jgi:ABC-2 type transport system permease protein
MLRDRSVLIWLLLVLSLSTLAVYFGMKEVNAQKAAIQSLIAIDNNERKLELGKHHSWGSTAYYTFHFTYDLPSEFAFAALGQRDLQPWKHRIRMLALEGQIYERDAGNPDTALIGRFDFAFLVAFIVPLILIALLYDLRSSERSAGREALLEVTVASAKRLWVTRAALRTMCVMVALILPLVAGAFVSNSPLVITFTAIAYVLAYVLFWALLVFCVAMWRQSGAVILTALIGCWLGLAVIIPSASRVIIDTAVSIPSSSDILTVQREAVNDAWDLPRSETMEGFFEAFPEWSNYSPVSSSFEWQWYYAFQQMGDLTTEPLTKKYRQGRLKREAMAAWTSLLSPPAFIERSLQKLAGTDSKAAIAYEDRVRAFHAELRDFYYPRFYRNAPFDKNDFNDLPIFTNK